MHQAKNAGASSPAYPNRQIIVAADWDGHLAENIGIISAQNAAQAIGGILATPLQSIPENASASLAIDFADIPRTDAAALIHAPMAGEAL